jgi:hypothetical protein
MTTAGMICPFCDSPDVELVSAWGGQLITSQMRCRSCNTHFEALRPDFAPSAAPGGQVGERRAGHVTSS